MPPIYHWFPKSPAKMYYARAGAHFLLTFIGTNLNSSDARRSG